MPITRLADLDYTDIDYLKNPNTGVSTEFWATDENTRFHVHTFDPNTNTSLRRDVFPSQEEGLSAFNEDKLTYHQGSIK